ncbi:hypothetical protein BDF20DRAFT_548446 [Mycotypha africana]|uniref:uncharacterized protein n=1 Tax=Mycotypha africana TaxID=64632 RepID=UPI002301C049|nr:uncharacterized protein BDF20DRAFT_548446 [Mycotypha africana]KAI8977158.1 hypothetical protein BDF20DRAFT_548446 [Mycotypha africana]
MIVGLKERSLVESVYVTVSCNSKTPISKRDLKKNKILDELSGVAGDAQDLLKGLAKIEKACLVVIDSAGLTTNIKDLELFLSKYPSLKKIIIETIAHDNQIHILESEDEIVEKRSLFRFDGREN